MELKRGMNTREMQLGSRRKKLHDIAGYYGSTAQSRQCIEECAELIQAISKWDRAQSSGDTEKVKTVVSRMVEEIADVRIMLDQLIYLYGCSEEVDKMIDEKINRHIVRIGMEIGMGIARDMGDNNG